MASIILGVGLMGISSLGTKGSTLASQAMGVLDATGVFGSGNEEASGPTYDANGYDSRLNISISDINPDSDFLFVLNGTGNGYTLTKYLGTDTSVVIPKTYNGLPVSTIGYQLYFNGMWNEVTTPFKGVLLSSVAIPNSVTAIDQYAFDNNTLTEVIIPESVLTIGDYAFARETITSIVIPDSVLSIGTGAFGSGRLTNVTLSANLSTMGSMAFEGNSITSVQIPNSLTLIPSSTFKDNLITTLVVTDEVTSIGDGAFRNNKLTSVEIGAKVSSIGYSTFSNNLLTSVLFKGSTPTTLGTNIFYSNLDLWVINVPSAYLASYQTQASRLSFSGSFVGY